MSYIFLGYPMFWKALVLFFFGCDIWSPWSYAYPDLCTLWPVAHIHGTFYSFKVTLRSRWRGKGTRQPSGGLAVAS